MELEHNYAKNGVANAGLATGIIGTSLGVLNSGLLNGGLFGGYGMNGMNGRGYGGYGYGGYGGYGMSPWDVGVNRYEMDLQQKIAAQDSHIRLLEADKYTDQKIADMYERMDRRLNGIEDRLCHQAVVNTQLAGNISCMQGNIYALNGMTKTVIPIDNVCPQPMTRFNTWVAPTATADAADTVVTG